MSKKILIIGANSYIARNLIYTISTEKPDLQVFACDHQPEHFDRFSGYTVVDILSVDSLYKLDFDVDFIFVFSGKTGTSAGFSNYDEFIDINEKGLLNILSVYKEKKSKAKIIFPSTRLVYKGKPGLLNEDSEKEFKTVYAINKFSCEQYLKMYSGVFDIDYCIFRICVPYGSLIPGASSYGTADFMINAAKKGDPVKLFGDGSFRRTVIYIRDLCDILINAALSSLCINDIFNIGGENYSLAEMATLISEKYNIPLVYTDWPDDALKIESGDTVFDSGKLESIIDCKCKFSFKDWVLSDQTN